MARYYGYGSRLVRTSRRGGEYNDEGFYWAYCPVERKRTEHERGDCCSCWNKRLQSK
jgi:hypothetical protein